MPKRILLILVILAYNVYKVLKLDFKLSALCKEFHCIENLYQIGKNHDCIRIRFFYSRQNKNKFFRVCLTNMLQKKKYIAFSSFQQQPIPLKLIVFDTQKKFVWSWKFSTTFKDTKNQFKLRNSGEIRPAVECMTKTIVWWYKTKSTRIWYCRVSTF